MLVDSWEIFHYLADRGWLRHSRVSFGEILAITHDFHCSEYCTIRFKETWQHGFPELPTWNRPRRRRKKTSTPSPTRLLSPMNCETPPLVLQSLCQ